MEHQCVVIGWRCPEWLNLVGTYITEIFATRRGSGLASIICLDEKRFLDTLRCEYISPYDDGTLLVLVRPLAHDILQVAERLAVADLWSRAELAVVNCRTNQIASVVDAVRAFPRWPVAWWPPYDDFVLNAKSLVTKLFTQQKQRAKLRSTTAISGK